MPATATTLVKAVWHGYFFGGRRPQSEEEAAGMGGRAEGVAGEGRDGGWRREGEDFFPKKKSETFSETYLAAKV